MRRTLEGFDSVAFTMRAAGSHGKVDVLALRNCKTATGRDALLIQCKTGGVISAEELEELGLIAHKTKMTAAVASKGRGRSIKLTGVDRNGYHTKEQGLASFLRLIGWE